jgi:hypothetical protein
MAACWALNHLGDLRESFKGTERLDIVPPRGWQARRLRSLPPTNSVVSLRSIMHMLE